MSSWAERVGDALPAPVHGGPRAGETGSDPLDFSVNVNPYAPAPSVRTALAELDSFGYPDPAALAPRQVAAALWHLSPDRVLFGAGATEFIHRAALAWLEPGDAAAVPAPSFSEYARAVVLARGRVVSVPPRDGRGSLDLARLSDAVCRERARMVYLGSPNVPTGEVVSPSSLASLRHSLPADCLLVLDESFRSFDTGTVAAGPTLGSLSGVLHVRSITKDCGLASLRAGFATGDAELMRLVSRVRLPWSASTHAQVAAAATLRPDAVAFLDRTLAEVSTAVRLLWNTLERLGWEPVPTRANFVTFRPPSADRLADALQARGVRVRRCASFGLPEYLRAGVRGPGSDRVLLRLLEELS